MSNKINLVRSMKSKYLREQDANFVKEIGWDDRFHLGKLSNYYSFKEINCIKIFLIYKK